MEKTQLTYQGHAVRWGRGSSPTPIGSPQESATAFLRLCTCSTHFDSACEIRLQCFCVDYNRGETALPASSHCTSLVCACTHTLKILYHIVFSQNCCKNYTLAVEVVEEYNNLIFCYTYAKNCTNCKIIQNSGLQNLDWLGAFGI